MPTQHAPDNPLNWAEMQVRGTLAARTYGAQPDIATWANQCTLDPCANDRSRANDPAVSAASARLAGVAERENRG